VVYLCEQISFSVQHLPFVHNCLSYSVNKLLLSITMIMFSIEKAYSTILDLNTCHF